MSTNTRQPQEIFSLDTLAFPLESFKPPTGPFDSQGPWRATYGIYTMPGQAGRAGEMRLARATPVNNSFSLRFRYDKNLVGGARQVTEATIQCANDALATPSRWTLDAVTLDHAGKPMPGTHIKKSGKATPTAESGGLPINPEVELQDDSGTRNLTIPGPYAINWALFEAVQRLPRNPGEPLHFTMVDHFDQPKPNQTLAYRSEEQVLLGMRTVEEKQTEQLEKGRITRTVQKQEGGTAGRFHTFHQLGHGIVPWVYWLDEQGRLLIASSGLEAYIAESIEQG
jgi:hypothetical protein